MIRFKKALCLVLAALMLTSLCACRNLTPGNNSQGNNGGNKNSSENSELAKQFVFRFDEFDFSSLKQDDSNGDVYTRNIMNSDGVIYMLTQQYDYTSGDVNFNIVSMDMEGKNMKIHPISKSMKDNDAAETEASKPDEQGEGADQDIPVRDVYEYTDFGSFTVAAGKYLYGNKTYNYNDYTNSENSIYDNYVCCWDLEGKMLWETSYKSLFDENSWHYLNTIIGKDDGTAILLFTGDDSRMYSVDVEGNMEPIDVSEDFNELMENSIGRIMTLADGSLFVTYYENDDWSKQYMVTYDFGTGKAGEAVQMPQSLLYNGMSALCTDANGDLMYSSGQGIYKYKIGDEEPVQVMSYINSDLYINYNMDAIMPIDDDHFIGMYMEYDDQYYHSTIKGGMFTRVPPEDIPDKSVMVLGGNGINSDLEKRVVDFNKSSNTHRIVIKDYSQYNTYEDYQLGNTQLNNDIISGDMPDILVVDNYSFSIDNYVSKGLLADIGELIAQDEELSKVEFLENVFEAYSVDGKLYEIIPKFYVRTYVGKKSLVGDRTNWTMDDAMQLLAGMPEDTSLFGDMTRNGFFTEVMNMCGSDFIDVSTGKCNFDSEGFISLMEFAKRLPEEHDDEFYDDYYQSYESQYRENRTILANCYMSSFENLVYTYNGYFDEPVSFVGFPNASGQGGVIYTNTSYALAADSDNLDAAWQFMRYYLTDEYQDSLDWGMPINKKRFFELAQNATKKPTYEDADGKEVESEYTWWINDEEINLDPLTDEQLKQATDYVQSITKKEYDNEYVLNIINEEMDAFYKDQKSARDVAAIIQSRAKIYVSENM